MWLIEVFDSDLKQTFLEKRGIDPRASHMQSERSSTWATPPGYYFLCISSYSSLSFLLDSDKLPSASTGNRTPASQASILPLNHRCSFDIKKKVVCFDDIWRILLMLPFLNLFLVVPCFQATLQTSTPWNKESCTDLFYICQSWVRNLIFTCISTVRWCFTCLPDERLLILMPCKFFLERHLLREWGTGFSVACSYNRWIGPMQSSLFTWCFYVLLWL